MQGLIIITIMERDKKIQLLLDMQEHPEQFSEQELQAMLDDPEVRELMEATAELKQAMMVDDDKANKHDADAEWQRFAATHFMAQPLPSHQGEGSGVGSVTYKIAASIIGVLMVSGIAFAAIHIIRHTSDRRENPQAPIEETRVTNQQLPADTLRTDSIASRVVRYDEATLEQILTDMADYYGLKLNWKSEAAKTLRLFYIWNKQQSAVEAISSMNSFERIRLELNDSILAADVQTSSPKQ